MPPFLFFLPLHRILLTGQVLKQVGVNLRLFEGPWQSAENECVFLRYWFQPASLATIILGLALFQCQAGWVGGLATCGESGLVF